MAQQPIDLSQVTPVPGITMLDTPIQVVTGGTPTETATAVTHANLTGKSKAILRCKAIVAVSGIAAQNTTGEVHGHVGSSSTLGNAQKVAIAVALMHHVDVTANVWNYDTAEVTVNLDGSSQFWHKVNKVVPGDVTVWFEIWLVGWHD